MDLVEGVEYFNMVLTAIKLQEGITAKMINHCTNVGTEEEKKYDVLCYRDKYFKVIFEDLGLSKYFPKYQHRC